MANLLLHSLWFKCDLVEEKNRPKAAILEKFCRDNGIAYWFFTSAKEDVSIEAAFRFLVYDVSRVVVSARSSLVFVDPLSLSILS